MVSRRLLLKSGIPLAPFPIASLKAMREEKGAIMAAVDETVRTALLQRVKEEGGFAYVSLAEKAAGGDLEAAEAAREMAWEQLHSGPWHAVVPAWRDAYAMACLQVAVAKAEKGEYQEALRVLDMGVIMGGLLLRKDLDETVSKVRERAARSSSETENGGKRWESGKDRSLEEVV